MRVFCKSKIHRISVTDKSLNYGGSITLGSDLVRAADIVEGEMVQVINLNTGERWHTYVVEDKENPNAVVLNGGGARLGEVGDELFILSYEVQSIEVQGDKKTTVVYVDGQNKVRNIGREILGANS